ncbi:MAG: sulfite exporter TauE/SafE family protein [Parvularculaceae bacterium]|nr:sulfite exporter TauE/SafE family protein [Parvularculaceae bacterium]
MIVLVIQGLLIAAALALGVRWFAAHRGTKLAWPAPVAMIIGAVVNFFDTLGIGSFAPSTAAIKFMKLTGDERIPGTLNVGHAIPTIVQALIFIAIVKVSVALLVACILAAVAGALIGARIVSRLPVNAIRIGMGLALLAAAGIFIARNLGLVPGGGDSLALEGPLFAAAVALHFVFGALMTLGVGLYAPALISLSLLGMDPRAAFPIMMGACAFLMPASGLQFIASGRFDSRLALGFAIGGIPAVLVAALIVKELPLDTLRWLVAGVVVLAALMMLTSAREAAPGKS